MTSIYELSSNWFGGTRRATAESGPSTGAEQSSALPAASDPPPSHLWQLQHEAIGTMTICEWL